MNTFLPFLIGSFSFSLRFIGVSGSKLLFLQAMRKLFFGIGKLWGISDNPKQQVAGADMAHVPSLENAWLLVQDGLVYSFGSMESDIPGADQTFDVKGKEVLPGLVDSHTHAVFAAPRTDEFVLRIKGAAYEEIAAAGGGILNSARKLRAMQEEELYEEAAVRIQRMMSYGSTTIEIKSGYGLDMDSELRILRVIKRLKESQPATIKATFLGAHAVPPEFKGNQSGYVDHVINDMLPRVVAEGLADHIDVFCDRGFFTPEETLRILDAGNKYGLPGKIHANELGLTGGVQAAVAANAWSADHLEHCGPDEIIALRNSSVMPVGLPGTSYFLGIPYTPGRAIIDAGLPFALATDFNPGSSPLASLQMVWSLACSQMKLLPEEAFHAITLNAARSIREENRCGILASGYSADFWITDTKNAMHTVPYFFGVNHASEVFISGMKV
jgi:imidazolonepropionase